MNPSGIQRERGGCLTIYLVLIIIGSVLGLISALTLGSATATLAAQGVAYELPGWYAPAWIVSIILALVGAFGTWTWKKWGLYVMAGSLVFDALISLLTGQVVGAIIGLVISLAIFWYVIRNKMPMFE